MGFKCESFCSVEYFPLVFTLYNPSALMNASYSITRGLLFFGVGRSPCFRCAASLNTEWAFPIRFSCTVMILQIWLCWLLRTAVCRFLMEHLICWRSESPYAALQRTCVVVALSGFIQKVISPPIGKPAAGMNGHVGGKKRWTKPFVCVHVFCLCLCFRSLPVGLISPNISTLMSEGTHTFSLGYS